MVYLKKKERETESYAQVLKVFLSQQLSWVKIYCCCFFLLFILQYVVISQQPVSSYKQNVK